MATKSSAGKPSGKVIFDRVVEVLETYSRSRHNGTMDLSPSTSPPNDTPCPQCRHCRHLIEWPYCFAFLADAGVPQEIRTGAWDHNLPYDGDHGIRFMPLDSPYDLSEEALKRLIAQYKGCVIMPFPAEAHDQDALATATLAALSAITAHERDPARHVEVAAPVTVPPQQPDFPEQPIEPVGNLNLEVSEAELLTACARGDEKTIRWLLDHGAAVDSRDRNNNTALMLACRNCHVEAVRLLLQRGADVNAKDNYSKTAMDIAADWGYPTLIALLKEYGGKESHPVTVHRA